MSNQKKGSLQLRGSKCFLAQRLCWESDNQVKLNITLVTFTFIIIRSFIEVVKFLFSLLEVKDNNLAFLSANLSQDPLENLDVRGKEGHQ